VTQRYRSPDRELREGIAFALLQGITTVAFRESVERNGSAAAAFRSNRDGPAKHEALQKADAVIARSRALGITLLLQGEPGYPADLLDLSDAPRLLYALGSVALLERRRVGIVGTRHSSGSGERLTHQMAGRLVRAGTVVVSGMAFGIDAAAHRGALDAGGGTIAVLGGGVDLPYPPSHALLHASIARDGLVVAEAPIGTRPTKGAFPRRNRIIAALSEPVIVIEAGDRSGALITSRLALELGRTVAAVPGPIDSPRHVGTNRLLFEGASFIGRIEDALSLAGVSEGAAAAPVEDAPVGETHVDPAHARILNAVRTGATDIEQLARSAGLAPRDLANTLAMLELTGHLVITDGATVSLASG
jgi:DNA processing protein